MFFQSRAHSLRFHSHSYHLIWALQPVTLPKKLMLEKFSLDYMQFLATCSSHQYGQNEGLHYSRAERMLGSQWTTATSTDNNLRPSPSSNHVFNDQQATYLPVTSAMLENPIMAKTNLQLNILEASKIPSNTIPLHQLDRLLIYFKVIQSFNHRR